MLLREWRRFKGWHVLEFFLSGGRRIHIKGLAKELKISPRTAQTYLWLYQNEGILDNERLGNLSLYSLSSRPLSMELKRTYLLMRIHKLVEQLVKDNKSIVSLVLYGSSARGDYDEHSDIDLLVVSNTKDLDLDIIKRIESSLDKEVKLEILSLGELRKLAEKHDDFYLSVMKNNIILYGVLP
jgi:uncharacterized protein